MKTSPHRFARGFSLVEVTLALGVAGFCLISLCGLLPVGVNSNQTSLEQTAAASAAANIVADLRATPLTLLAPSPQFAIPVPSAAGGKHTIFLREDGAVAAPAGTAPASAVDVSADPSQNPRYRVTLTFFSPPSSRAATLVRVLVTWPALADRVASVDPSKFSGSFETVTALDRQ